MPTLRSFLKLYTSLDAAKLAGFLDADEEEMVQQMMAVKAASRSVSRVGNEQNLLDGQMISTSDMDFVINEVCFTFFRPHLGRRNHQMTRTWSTYLRSRSAAASLAGLYGTRSTHSACWTESKIVLCPLLLNPPRQRQRASPCRRNKRRLLGACPRHRIERYFILGFVVTILCL